MQEVVIKLEEMTRLLGNRYYTNEQENLKKALEHTTRAFTILAAGGSPDDEKEVIYKHVTTAYELLLEGNGKKGDREIPFIRPLD